MNKTSSKSPTDPEDDTVTCFPMKPVRVCGAHCCIALKSAATLCTCLTAPESRITSWHLELVTKCTSVEDTDMALSMIDDSYIRHVSTTPRRQIASAVDAVRMTTHRCWVNLRISHVTQGRTYRICRVHIASNHAGGHTPIIAQGWFAS